MILSRLNCGAAPGIMPMLISGLSCILSRSVSLFESSGSKMDPNDGDMRKSVSWDGFVAKSWAVSGFAWSQLKTNASVMRI